MTDKMPDEIWIEAKSSTYQTRDHSLDFGVPYARYIRAELVPEAPSEGKAEALVALEELRYEILAYLVEEYKTTLTYPSYKLKYEAALGCLDKNVKTIRQSLAQDHTELLRGALSVIEDAQNGMNWYADMHPEHASAADAEMAEKIEAVKTKLNTALRRGDDGS